MSGLNYISGIYANFFIPISFRTTTVSLKQDVRVSAEPQPCVSPALCQDHADLPECAELDDELDCPGELAESSGAFIIFGCPTALASYALLNR